MSCQFGVMFTEPAAPHCLQTPLANKAPSDHALLANNPHCLQTKCHPITDHGSILRQRVQPDIDHAPITFAAEAMDTTCDVPVRKPFGWTARRVLSAPLDHCLSFRAADVAATSFDVRAVQSCAFPLDNRKEREILLRSARESEAAARDGYHRRD
jgi:hypothetical protein